MKLEELFNSVGELFKVVDMKHDGDEFTEAYFEDERKAFEYAQNCYEFQSDYDKKHSQIAVRKLDIKRVDEIGCDLEEETDKDFAREYLLFSGCEETIIGG